MTKRGTILLTLVLACTAIWLVASAAENEPAACSQLEPRPISGDRSPVDLVAFSRRRLAGRGQPDFRQRLAGPHGRRRRRCPKSPAAAAPRPSSSAPTTAAAGQRDLQRRAAVLAIDGQTPAPGRLGPSGLRAPRRGDFARRPAGLRGADGRQWVAVVDLESLSRVARIAVGRWPRYLALTPDGSRLAVGCSGDGGITVVDTASSQAAVRYEIPRPEHRPRADLGRRPVRLLSLDGVCRPADHAPTTFAKAGCWAIAWPACGSTGRPAARRWRSIRAARPSATRTAWPSRPTSSGWPGRLGHARAGGVASGRLAVARRRAGRSHASSELAHDADRFFRIPLGGRPMGIRFDRDGRTGLCGQLSVERRAGGQPGRAARGADDRSRWASQPSRTRWPGAARRFSTTPAAAPTAGTVATAATTKGAPTPSPWTPRTTARSAPTKWCSACATCRTRAPGSGTAGRRISRPRCAKAWATPCKGPPATDDDVRPWPRISQTLPAPPNSHRAADGRLSEAGRARPQALRRAMPPLRRLPQRTLFHRRPGPRRRPGLRLRRLRRLQHARHCWASTIASAICTTAGPNRSTSCSAFSTAPKRSAVRAPFRMQGAATWSNI